MKKPTTFESQLYGATVDITNKRIYFWGGIFSQWAKCDIHDHILNEHLNCSEQGMMLYKAKTFGDDESYAKILASKDPREQKALGRKVKGFDAKVWEDVALKYVTHLNRLKFTQNATWRELLIVSDGYEIVEASPYDKIWGIGLSEQNEDIYDKSKWKGQNLLGEAIMTARLQIIKSLTKKL